MNERIKQLWEQAAKTTQGDSWEEQTKFMERFAELIVAECAAIINDIPSSPQGSWSDGYYEGCTDSAKQIKQHFGVEL